MRLCRYRTNDELAVLILSEVEKVVVIEVAHGSERVTGLSQHMFQR